MITSMILSGGAYAQSYDFMSPSSSIQLEKGFSDGIAQRGASMIARDPYTEIVTTIPLTAVGTSEADAWNAYNTFATFAQQIAGFPLAPDRNPIIWGYKTTAAATIMYSLCLGAADRNPNSPIVSPPTGAVFDDVDSMYRIRGFKITFRRKGRLARQTAESLAAVTAGTTNSPANGRDALGVFPADFTTDSPLDVEFTFTASEADIVPAGNAHFIMSNPYLITDESFIIWNGNQIGSQSQNPATYTLTPDTVVNTYPYSGVGANLLRWQAVDNNVSTREGFPASTPFRNFIALAIARSDIAASSSIMQLYFTDGYNKIMGKTAVLSGDAKVKVLNFGAFSIADSGIYFGITNQNTSGALSRIWIDQIILINLNVANLAHMIGGPVRPGVGINAYTYKLSQRYLSAASPEMTGTTSGATLRPQMKGAGHMSVKTRYIRSLFLGVGSDTFGLTSTWRTFRTSNYSVTYRANRAGLAPLGI